MEGKLLKDFWRLGGLNEQACTTFEHERESQRWGQQVTMHLLSRLADEVSCVHVWAICKMAMMQWLPAFWSLCHMNGLTETLLSKAQSCSMIRRCMPAAVLVFMPWVDGCQLLAYGADLNVETVMPMSGVWICRLEVCPALLVGLEGLCRAGRA